MHECIWLEKTNFVWTNLLINFEEVLFLHWFKSIEKGSFFPPVKLSLFSSNQLLIWIYSSVTWMENILNQVVWGRILRFCSVIVARINFVHGEHTSSSFEQTSARSQANKRTNRMRGKSIMFRLTISSKVQVRRHHHKVLACQCIIINCVCSTIDQTHEFGIVTWIVGSNQKKRWWSEEAKVSVDNFMNLPSAIWRRRRWRMFLPISLLCNECLHAF